MHVWVLGKRGDQFCDVLRNVVVILGGVCRQLDFDVDSGRLEDICADAVSSSEGVAPTAIVAVASGTWECGRVMALMTKLRCPPCSQSAAIAVLGLDDDDRGLPPEWLQGLGIEHVPLGGIIVWLLRHRCGAVPFSLLPALECRPLWAIQHERSLHRVKNDLNWLGNQLHAGVFSEEIKRRLHSLFEPIVSILVPMSATRGGR